MKCSRDMFVGLSTLDFMVEILFIMIGKHKEVALQLDECPVMNMLQAIEFECNQWTF